MMDDRTKELATVIMAAGIGTRMKDPSRAKVMFELRGKPLLHYVLKLASEIESNRVVAIVGYQKHTVIDFVKNFWPSVEYVVQEPQLGTGHAVMQVEVPLRNFSGDILVLSGDVPLLSPDTVEGLMAEHRGRHAIATVLTTDLEDPTGYGRVIRDADGGVQKIVEHRDASAEERAIKEINSGIYVFDKSILFDGLKQINRNNDQGEYYLTDIFEFFWKNSLPVAAWKVHDPDEIRGINTVEQLGEAEELVMKYRRFVSTEG